MAATCSTDSTVWFVVSVRSESRSRQKPNAAEHARTSEVTGRARRVLGRVAIGGVGARWCSRLSRSNRASSIIVDLCVSLTRYRFFETIQKTRCAVFLSLFLFMASAPEPGAHLINA